MITCERLNDIVGATAHDGSGGEIGEVDDVCPDDGSDQPTWPTVHTGPFGGNEASAAGTATP